MIPFILLAAGGYLAIQGRGIEAGGERLILGWLGFGWLGWL